MNISTIELKKITPSEGMVLTNGKTFSEEVYLGINDSEENWHEIPCEEYEKIKAAEERSMSIGEFEYGI